MADPNEELRNLVVALATNVTTLSARVTDLTNTVNNFINAAPTGGAAAGGAAGGAGTGGTAAAAPAFATSPATANVDALIDYSTKYGFSIYEQGIKSLYDGEENAFDLDNDKVTAFQRDVNDRAELMGWDSTTQGIITYVVNGSNINIIHDYGQIELDEIISQSEPFYLHNGANHDKRAAQNNAMMAKMLRNSLTPSARNQVALYKKEYELDDGSGTNKKIILAPAYYKIIMRLTTLDTKMTNQALRDVIKGLPAYATKVNGDIVAIHKRFDDHYTMLKARGEDVEDKEGILFNTYSHVPDAEFRKYMKDKKDAYIEDINDMKGAKWEDIMKKAMAKYKLLQSDTTYEWGSPSEEESKIIALRAEVLEIKDKNLQLSKALKQKAAKDNEGPANQKANPPSNSNANPRNQQRTRNKKNRSDKQRQNQDEAWKKVPPKQNEPKSKQHGIKTWNWCKHHQAWCIHKESDCDKGKQLEQKVANQATTNTPSEPATPQSAINPAYAQMLAHIATISE